jgi:DNA polymerase-4
MVDVSLPLEQRERPLRYLFLDLNAYFASVEQQERPELRGKPIVVGAVEVDTSFCIAASYEAKRYGIKTGTQIGEAKRLCPDLTVVHARPQVYVGYHRRVIDVVETVLPVNKVCSIDEMRCRLIGDEREPANAINLAKRIKSQIRKHVGEVMQCSIGIAPNAFLAKIGTELQKPDGLVVLEASDLPAKLYSLGLTDFTGINKRMQARLNAHGIFDSTQLCSATKEELALAFGSITGERWWYLLRGWDLQVDESNRKSLGHSHVLPPDLRTDQGCREVLLRLLQKASARLRSNELWTAAMTISVSGFKKSWTVLIKLPPTQDTVTLNEFFLKAWESRDFENPRSVSVTFTELRAAEAVTPSLFEDTRQRSQLNHAVDEINQKFGKHSVFLAGMEKVRDAASEKIAFNKTWLFSEGKGDHEWIDTFRGLTESDS